VNPSGVRCGGPASIGCAPGFVCSHSIDDRAPNDGSGIYGMCVQSVSHHLRPPVGPMEFAVLFAMFVLIIGLFCRSRRARQLRSRLVGKRDGSTGPSEDVERVRLVGGSVSGGAGAVGDESRQRKRTSPTRKDDSGFEMHGLMR
jgi:hypothetical protein